MKNQQPETIQMTSVSETETIPINFKAFQPQKLLQASAQDARCSAKQRASLVCISKTCTSLEPFLCSNIQCSCQEIHEQCTKVNLRFITKKISQKIMFSSNLKSQLENLFEKIIDEISELRDKVLQQIDTKIKYANLHGLENSFLKVLHSSSLKEHMQQGEMDALWKVITDKNSNKSDPFQKLTQKVNALQTQVSQSSNSILQFIDEQSKRLEKHHVLFEQSRLELCSSENIERLEGFFMKKIKEASCVFRASQNNFSTTQFYKNCGKIGSLMIVCQTNMDKIIGGYTPLEIGSDGGDYYASDPSQQSFIFSLSNNDKFTMKTSSNAIYRVANQQRICFGGCQFQICNNANLVKKCRSYSLNYYYENPKYQANDKSSFLRFNGNSDQFFTLKEWEAWKIQFQN